jgi:hypothetical protein
LAQISIHLPDAIEQKARKAAKSSRKSVSRWIADRVRQDLEDVWPQEVLDAIGADPDFPSVEELRKSYGKDVRLEDLD